MPIKLHLRKANASIVLFMISCSSAKITSYDVISPPQCFFPGAATAREMHAWRRVVDVVNEVVKSGVAIVPLGAS